MVGPPPPQKKVENPPQMSVAGAVHAIIYIMYSLATA